MPLEKPIRKVEMPKTKNRSQIVSNAKNFERFTRWKAKSDLSTWDGYDVLGYWLDKFYSVYKTDDPDFEGEQWTNSGKLAANRMTIYFKAGNMGGRFIHSPTSLNGDCDGVRKYIDWIFDTFLPDNQDWFTGPPSFLIMFRASNNKFFKRFLKSKIKAQFAKKTDTWKPWGTGK